MELKTALNTLGIEVLRPFQKEALNTLLTGRSLLTLMPTSAGKSLIFTSFAMVRERLTLVIEPHLALELDQVRQLQDKGVAAACLNSLQSSAENLSSRASSRASCCSYSSHPRCCRTARYRRHSGRLTLPAS